MVGGSQSTQREPTHSRGEHANSTQKGPSRELNLEPSCCEATVLTTTPPCSPVLKQWPSKKDWKEFTYFPSTVQSMNELLIKSGGISLFKGPESKSLRRHCNKNSHWSIADITKWTREYCGKQYNTELHSQMPLPTFLCIKEALCLPCPEAPPTFLGLEESGMDHHTVETCIVVRPISIPDLFGRHGRCVLWIKNEKKHPDCLKNVYCDFITTYTALQDHIISWDVHAFFNTQKTVEYHFLQRHGIGRRSSL